MASEDVIENFLQNYKQTTRYGYASALFCYLDCVYNYSRQNKRVTSENRTHYAMLASRYLNEGRNYTDDILLFQSKCGKPTNTIENYRSIVIEFLRSNGIKIEGSEFKRIKQKTPKHFELNGEQELSMDIIKMLIEHSDIRMKALFFTLLTTGLRISEVLSFKTKDLEIIEEYGKLHLEWYDNKVGREIYALTTPECVGIINEWLKVRSKYIKEKCVNQSKKEDDGRIFPFTKSNATEAFHNIQERIGYTPNEKGDYPFHFHQFRKFYLSQLNLIISPEITQYLIGGHSRDISAIYRRYSFKQVFEEYKKGSDAITIGTDPVLKKKYKHTIIEMDKVKQNQNLNNEQISTLITQIGIMQTKLDMLETKNRMFENVIAGLADGKIKLNPNGMFIDIETKS